MYVIQFLLHFLCFLPCCTDGHESLTYLQGVVLQICDQLSPELVSKTNLPLLEIIEECVELSFFS